MRYLISYAALALSFVLLEASPSTAQDEGKEETRFVTADQAWLHSAPGAARIGSALRNAPVKVGQERGRWTHVQFDAWVKTTDIGVAKSSLGSSQGKSAELDIVSASIKTHEDKSAEIFLTLVIANKTNRTIKSWDGLLVAETKDSTVLFTTQVLDDAANLGPGKSKDVVFSWTAQEEPYNSLTSFKAEDLELYLKKVEIK